MGIKSFLQFIPHYVKAGAAVWTSVHIKMNLDGKWKADERKDEDKAQRPT